MSHRSPDVIVVGGGPAGSSAATMLARQGVRVLLLERARFPRDHVGESLLPASIPVLEELGVMPAIEGEGFLPKWGATMVWGSQTAPWTWRFKETNTRHPHAYQVWRPRFDQLLLENCREWGVDVCEGHQVTDLIFDGDRTVGVRFTSEGSSQQEARAEYVVDATGQAGLVGRRLGLRRWDDFFKNLAVYAYFRGAQPLPSPDENNIFIESYDQGWLWSIPLHNGLTSVGAVVDSAVGQKGITGFGALGFLIDQIQRSQYTARMLQGAVMDAGPSVVRDWSYDSERLVGDGFVLAGDAGCFVDPLFSSGVHLALMSGVLGAAYVTTALKGGDIVGPAALAYQETYHNEYVQFRELARLFYSSNRSADSYFWEARRISRYKDSSPRESFIRTVAGQSPRGYERAVINSGQAPPDFLEGVNNLEVDLARRKGLADSAPEHFLWESRPIRSQGVQALRKPVIGEGEYVWGHVLTTPARTEGVPVSGFVALLVSRLEGKATFAETVANLGPQAQSAEVRAAALATLKTLYTERAIQIPGL